MKKVEITTTRSGLTMRWVPVSTTDGRRHLEMRWTAPHTLRRATA